MCDELTNEAAKEYAQTNRADFAKNLSLPEPKNACEIKALEIDIDTEDGVADTYLVHPQEGRHPAVLIWADILGLRRSFRLMANRLAQSGYTVLVINPYYRVARGAVVEEGADFTQPGIPDIVVPLAMTLSSDTCLRDGREFVEFLTSHPSVDINKKIGSTGYCMTGAYPLRLAADMPDRIGAAVSFHGNDMITDTDDSPHQIAQPIQAGVLIVIAENDDETYPDNKTLLTEAFHVANVDAEIEVYQGTLHGFCPPDSAVHNREQAERAWERQLALFDKYL